MDINEFELRLKDKIAMVDFGAAWCGPCRQLEPIIEDMEKKYRNKAHLIQVDINAEPSLASNYMVQSIPTLIFFDHGREVSRLIGLQSRKTLEGKLDELIDATPA